jgi:hypothetical protein
MSMEGIGPNRKREPGFVYSEMYVTKKTEYPTSKSTPWKRVFFGSCCTMF